MRRNHPRAEFRKADPRQAAVGISIQFCARIGLLVSKILPSRTDLRSFARLFHYRLLAVCLQISAIALLLMVGPRATIESRNFQAAGSSLISSSYTENCAAKAGDEAPAHQRSAHAQCCVTCAAAGRDPLALVIAAIYVAGYCFLSAACVFVAYFIRRRFFARVLGWASSWSSRAPPVSP